MSVFSTSSSTSLIAFAGREHYRLYAIHKIPSLKVLDFSKVKPSERERAERLATSAAGATLENDVQQEARTAKTFTPGEAVDGGRSFVASFSAEQKEQIRELLAEASSAKEIEEIESAVRRGVLPEALTKRKRKAEDDAAAVEPDLVEADASDKNRVTEDKKPSRPKRRRAKK
jgi:U2 small nuclear ribonucleoprotein A'